MSENSFEVRDNREAGRYELEVEGAVAFLEYRRTDGAIALVRAVTPPPLRKRGLAGRLTRHALETARDSGLRVLPICPFVGDYIRKHPEFAPLIGSGS